MSSLQIRGGFPEGNLSLYQPPSRLGRNLTGVVEYAMKVMDDTLALLDEHPTRLERAQ
jgi:hypothetical protein